MIRRGLGVSTYGEIEDIDGAIAKWKLNLLNIQRLLTFKTCSFSILELAPLIISLRFLRDHMEDDPPALKAVIMPRMKLCSLHALAAQNLHRVWRHGNSNYLTDHARLPHFILLSMIPIFRRLRTLVFIYFRQWTPNNSKLTLHSCSFDSSLHSSYYRFTSFFTIYHYLEINRKKYF